MVLSFLSFLLPLIFASLLISVTAIPVVQARPTNTPQASHEPVVVVKEIVRTKTVVRTYDCTAPHAPTRTPVWEHGSQNQKPGGSGFDDRSDQPLRPKRLIPSRHPSTNGRDKNTLRTCTKLDLYYSESSFSHNFSESTNSSMAVVHIPHLKYPAVELISSDYISKVSCNATSAEIFFNDPDAYAVAAANWTQQAGRFVMLSAFDDCRNAAAELDNEYMVVDRVIADNATMRIQAVITHSDFENVVGADTIVTVDLGTYSPSGISGFNATAIAISQHISVADAASTANLSSAGRVGLDNFDEDLDRARGRTIAINDIENQHELFPGLDTSSLLKHDLSGFSESELELISRRGLFDWFKNVADTIVKGTVDFFTEEVPDFFKDLPDAIQDTIDWVEAGTVEVSDALDDFWSVNKDYTGSVSVNNYPSNSQFQIPGITDQLPAYQLYDSDNVKAYCVQCGADGQVTITGTVAFSISKGFISGKISADGSLRGTVALGLIGHASQNLSIPEQHLVTVALSDLVLGTLVQIGPAVSLAAGADLTLVAAGELLAGVTLEWPEISASLDIVNQESHASGFAPVTKPIFEAAGRVSASADIYSLISLELTVSVLAGQFRTSVALVDRPGIIVKAGIEGRASYSDNSLSAGFVGDCQGVGISANIYNKLYVNVLGLYKSDLHYWESPSVETCIAIQQSKREVVNRPRPLISAVPHRRSVNTTLSVSLSSLDGALTLRYARNGNIYAIPSSQKHDQTMEFGAQQLPFGLFSADTNVSAIASAGYNATTVPQAKRHIIYGTSAAHVLHAYRSELDTWGVSRLRVADPLVMPARSVVMALGEVDVGGILGRMLAKRQQSGGGSGKVVMATDTMGEMLWPVVCNFDGLFSKVFLVKDLDSGIRTLMSDNARGKFIEGEVTGCGYVPFYVS